MEFDAFFLSHRVVVVVAAAILPLSVVFCLILYSLYAMHQECAMHIWNLNIYGLWMHTYIHVYIEREREKKQKPAIVIHWKYKPVKKTTVKKTAHKQESNDQRYDRKCQSATTTKAHRERKAEFMVWNREKLHVPLVCYTDTT